MSPCSDEVQPHHRHPAPCLLTSCPPQWGAQLQGRACSSLRISMQIQFTGSKRKDMDERFCSPSLLQNSPTPHPCSLHPLFQPFTQSRGKLHRKGSELWWVPSIAGHGEGQPGRGWTTDSHTTQALRGRSSCHMQGGGGWWQHLCQRQLPPPRQNGGQQQHAEMAEPPHPCPYPGEGEGLLPLCAPVPQRPPAWGCSGCWDGGSLPVGWHRRCSASSLSSPSPGAVAGT